MWCASDNHNNVCHICAKELCGDIVMSPLSLCVPTNELKNRTNVPTFTG